MFTGARCLTFEDECFSPLTLNLNVPFGVSHFQTIPSPIPILPKAYLIKRWLISVILKSTSEIFDLKTSTKNTQIL